MPLVLLVEDEPLICELTKEGLEAEGFEVITAYNATQAIRLLETHDSITTIFTDVNMPGMDGLVLAALVRDRWPPINIIVTSGRPHPVTGKMPDGAKFLNKPYEVADVASAIRAFA